MKVAIVHYWLKDMRGGEKVVEALCNLFPSADIFTLFYDENSVTEKLRSHSVQTSALNRIPGIKKWYKSLLPLMPFALEHFDMSPYDLVISSESGPAKGIIPRPDALHICYCHSPMRYIWDHYHQYSATANRLTRAAMPIFAPMLRQWDVTTASRVDKFIANSRHVANRIKRYYHRSATIIYPPVSVNDFAPTSDIGDFYLCAGHLVPYKRINLAVQAFTEMKKKLVVIGGGEELARLRVMSGPTITLMERQTFPVLKDHMARCRALIFPGEEDFGMTPVEVMASGRPVIAFGRGGALETVVPGATGLLFDQQSVADIVEAVHRFEAMEESFNSETIRERALLFSDVVFQERMNSFVEEALEDHNREIGARTGYFGRGTEN